MIVCSYCNEETLDEEFCDNCGKLLERKIDNSNDNNLDIEDTISEDTSNSSNESSAITIVNEYNYAKTTLDCIMIDSKLKEKHITIFDKDRIQNPILIKDEKLFFIDEDSITLEEYLDNNELSLNEIYKLIYAFLEIFKMVEEKNLIFGSINMSDFWIKNNNLSSLFYRQTNRFLSENDDLEDYTIGKISSPEIKNKNIEYINEKTDIYLIGTIFINLVLSNKTYIQNYEHLRFIGYNLALFNSNIPIELHTWLDKTTNIYLKDRYSNITECMEHFLDIIDNHDLRTSDYEEDVVLTIDTDCITHVGKGKSKNINLSEVLKKSSLDGLENLEELLKVAEDYKKANEDSYALIQEEDKLFAMVADGVSNCTFGSGYMASNIVQDICTTLWNRYKEDIYDEESIRDFVSKIIEESNRRILQASINEVDDTSLLKKGIMATTFSCVIIINSEAYYISLGDSPIYLLSKDNISLLSIEDNSGNKKIKNGLSWNEYTKLEDKYHLVKFIGGDFALKYLNEDDENQYSNLVVNFDVNKIKLLKDDMIIICSDGVTDYINSASVRDDIWNSDNKLKSIILEENISLSEINKKLVNEANNNGGGDNITSILIKVTNMEEYVQWQEN